MSGARSARRSPPVGRSAGRLVFFFFFSLLASRCKASNDASDWSVPSGSNAAFSAVCCSDLRAAARHTSGKETLPSPFAGEAAAAAAALGDSPHLHLSLTDWLCESVTDSPGWSLNVRGGFDSCFMTCGSRERRCAQFCSPSNINR